MTWTRACLRTPAWPVWPAAPASTLSHSPSSPLTPLQGKSRHFNRLWRKHKMAQPYRGPWGLSLVWLAINGSSSKNYSLRATGILRQYMLRVLCCDLRQFMLNYLQTHEDILSDLCRAPSDSRLDRPRPCPGSRLYPNRFWRVQRATEPEPEHLGGSESGWLTGETLGSFWWKWFKSKSKIIF